MQVHLCERTHVHKTGRLETENYLEYVFFV